METVEKKVHITFQAPLSLQQKISELAVAGRRSRSEQVILLLEDALGVPPGTYFKHIYRPVAPQEN